MSESSIRALLIGIDHYLPNRIEAPAGFGHCSYPSLRGCVNDVARVEALLGERLHVAAERIVKLTATDPARAPPPLDERKPTYVNIVAALLELCERARPDEQIYIHYSGHGGRARTRFPALKSELGLDEALVPMDIGDDSTRYLVDVELGYLLRVLADKGALVTLVLDCCHAGGMTRAPHVTVRGGAAPDLRARPPGSALGDERALAAAWSRPIARGATTMVPLAEGARHTLLAACRQNELAQEYPFDGGQPEGVLTHHLLQALRAEGALGSYSALHDRIVAEVHGRFAQTPQLEGNAERAVLGTAQLLVAHGIDVLRVDEAGVLLNAGRAHGLTVDIQLTVHPVGAVDWSQSSSPPLIAIRELAGVTAVATIVEPGTLAITPGCLASPLRVTLPLVRGVHLDVGDAEAFAAELRAAIAKAPEGLLALDVAPASFHALVRPDGVVELGDAGGAPLRHLGPEVRVGAPGAAAGIAARLVHLARFQNIRSLLNDDCALGRSLAIDLFAAPAGYTGGPAPDLSNARALGANDVLPDGALTFLRVRNQGRSVLNVTILDLQPDWGISRLFPTDSRFMTLEPDRQELIALRFSLPNGYDEGCDVLKLFATLDTTDFDWLLLPALDVAVDGPAPTPAPMSRAALTPTDRLLQTIAGGQARGATAASSRADWTARNREVHIKKRA